MECWCRTRRLETPLTSACDSKVTSNATEVSLPGKAVSFAFELPKSFWSTAKPESVLHIGFDKLTKMVCCTRTWAFQLSVDIILDIHRKNTEKWHVPNDNSALDYWGWSIGYCDVWFEDVQRPLLHCHHYVRMVQYGMPWQREESVQSLISRWLRQRYSLTLRLCIKVLLQLNNE